MSLQKFISKVQSNVILNPRFGGIPAVYSRRVENQEGEPTHKSVNLTVSPQGNYATADKQIEARINVLWAKTADLKFGDESFLPKEGDEIRYKVDGVLHRYRVAVVLLPSGEKAAFSYEDGLHSIVKINTVRIA